jgi:hypothetical protein
MTETIYHLDDFIKIKDISKIPVSIDIQRIVDKLITDLGISSYVTKPIIVKGDNRKKENKRNKEYTDDDAALWKTMSDFKTTVIADDSKTEMDEILYNIRMHLNKMSVATYEKNRDIIMENISRIESDRDKTKVCEIIFDVVGINRLFTEIYANLYSDISDKYPIFLNELTTYLNQIVDNIKKIQYVDVNTNYDEHCLYNKANDSRKVMVTFIIYMMKKGVLSTETIIDIAIEILDIITSWIDISGKINEVDELIETLFLFISHGFDEFKVFPDKWKYITEQIIVYSKYKPKEKPSLNSRSIFKCIDIVKKYM